MSSFPITLLSRLVAGIVCLAGVPMMAAAQAEPAGAADPPIEAAARPPWQIGAWVGVARESPVTALLGQTPGRDHLFLGFDGTRQVAPLGTGRLAYKAQVVPVVSISGRTPPLDYPGALAADGLLPVPSRAYAFGFSPLGFELATAQTRRVSVFAAAAGGALVFTRPFPVPEAQRVNFTVEYGAGVRVRTRTGQWVQIGYKFHHLSNAYLGDMNPGLDGHVVYGGYQWSAPRRR